MPPPRRLTDSDYVYLLLQEILLNQVLQLFVIAHYLTKLNSRKRKHNTQVAPYHMIPRIPDQVKHMRGLVDGRYVSVQEQVAMFLSVLAHHKKNRVVSPSLFPMIALILVGSGLRWEGSAADSRILRDALNRANGLKVPKGALDVDGDEFVDTVESSPKWNAARDHLANRMWNDYINAT
ncbi:nuclease [Perilla frutescens var. hirtella]|nr:nuclease [Perilla frutescens var. hirtella]